MTMTFQKKQWVLPLQMLAGAVDKKQLLPILSTLLARFSDTFISLTATDLEIEITAKIPLTEPLALPDLTIPAKKFFDLIRVLDEDTHFDIQLGENNKTFPSSGSRESVDMQVETKAQHTLFIHTESAKFKFLTLDPETFPLVQADSTAVQLSFPRLELIRLLQSTAFTISQQDVRVFLNGMLFEFNSNHLTTVAADGHRMAIARSQYAEALPCKKLILPRKSVYELLRLLGAISDESVQIHIGDQLFKIQTESYSFSSKLIDSQFLPYQQAIPKQLNTFVLIEKESLKRALMSIMIIANDRSRPAVLEIGESNLVLLAQNQEQEQVVERVSVTIDGAPIRIGVNPYYLLDVLTVFQEGLVRLSFSTPDKSILVESLQDEAYQYILMPMKL